MMDLDEPFRWRSFAGTSRRAGTVVDPARPATHAHPVIVRLGVVVAAIGPDGHMVDAHEVDCARYHFAPRRERAGKVITDDVPISCAAHDAAMRHECLQNGITLVSLMV